METPSFLEAAEKLFSPEEREEIVATVSADPECGDIIAGTGGFRKLRFGRSGMGKRRVARIVYVLRNEHLPVFLITAYAKNVKGEFDKSRTQRTGENSGHDLHQV